MLAGSATVTVTATDTGGLEAEAGFTVTVEQPNRAPEVAEAIPAQTINVGDTVRLVVSAYFTDPDDDELSYEAVSADTGVAEALAMGDTVMIAAMSAGQATVAVTATDPEGLMATQDVAVTVQGPQNQAPDAVDSIPAHDLVVDSAVVLDMSAYFADPDGDELTYSVSSSDEAVAVASAEGSVVTTMGISAMEEETVRMATLTVTATDPDGLSATQEADVFVATMDYEVWEGLGIARRGRQQGQPPVLVGRRRDHGERMLYRVADDRFRFSDPLDRVAGPQGYGVGPGAGDAARARNAGRQRHLRLHGSFADGTAPAGTYRVVGEVTVTEEGQDPVRIRRKTENEYVHNPES